MSAAETTKLLTEIKHWKFDDTTHMISRVFNFRNYYQTIAFVNTVAWVSHQQDHHPDMNISYNSCHVNYSTHSLGGLSINDFICAAKIDNVFTVESDEQ